MRLQDARKDYYRRLAKEEGYKSRAAYKLLEAVTKYKLIKQGERVLDLGSAPGGWLQVASEAVGDKGLVVGVDLDPVKRLTLDNLRTFQMDVYDPKLPDAARAILPRGEADVLLADLSPNISGTWDLDHYKQIELTLRALALGDELLRPGGNAMLKIFEGERFAEIKKEAERRFDRVVIMKPHASRRESSEMYLVCLGRRK
jgi:23S rRNA (uridine2552-2'-O)-methyltransferase